MKERERRRSDLMRRFEEACTARGLPLTVQRRIIIDAVADRSDHPTADRILDEVKSGHPEISRATVYRTLEMLVELGMVRKVCHDGPSIRYDPNMDRHHHLICRKCHKLIDYDDPHLDRIPLPSAHRQGFLIEDYTIQFRGICAGCLGRRGSPPGKRGKRKDRR